VWLSGKPASAENSQALRMTLFGVARVAHA
jgi:hypothetical protein